LPINSQIKYNFTELPYRYDSHCRNVEFDVDDSDTKILQ